ncbi:MAG TPA: ScpA family protein [Rhodocyclaceae bacterium]|jgi:segregation and condensation protein A|nr:ScpA family protein [Rhodocyclaceae bacterium]
MAEIIAFPAEHAHHVARLYGEPLDELPKDLYIPPDALEVFLETFEGPLDLLLYLIRRANIDILDIPMAPLTAQYLVYVEAMRSRNLELAAEYLLMAAMLLEIKSRMLLPRPRKAQEHEAEDPRAELVRRLVEYERMKLAAAGLDALPQAGRDVEWVGVWIAREVSERLPEVSLNDLQLAWLRVARHARITQHHRVRREELSVREHMSRILRRLRGGGYVEFDKLFEPVAGAPGLVVSFLAVLELVREKLVEAVQREVFAPIYVRLADVPADEPA